MSTRRERAKTPTAQLNKQLAGVEIEKPQLKDCGTWKENLGKYLIDISKYVVTGVIIASTFKDLDDKYLVAPCDGVISGIYPRIGELVIMGLPLMTISNLDEMWVAFNVREDKLNGLVVGKEINVMIPALGNKEAKMSVFSVRDKGSFATWTATKTYGGHDNKTFEVKARPVNKIENFGPGMVVIMK